jgi:oxygen-independent coproporphyrinogen-3 oxidase
MTLALYLHIPFCQRKCSYCDFPSVDAFPCALDDYVAALVREMTLRAATLPVPAAATSLYLGGGTPSLLAPEQVGLLLTVAQRHYGLAADAEVTLEVNPGTVVRAKLNGYRSAGVNRLSIGVQSLDNALLRRLGRIHTADEARSAVALARGAGFDNLGIDLIHGLPGQSLAQWQETLLQARALQPEHISAYGLTVEEGTPFAALAAAGELVLPEEETAARMVELTGELLAAAGYEQYEIANFARPGCRSRHNQVYWQRTSYLGFGPGAHSFLAANGWGVRWRCPADIPAYLAAIDTDRLPEADRQELDREEAASESMFLGLRLLAGVDEAVFAACFGGPIEALFPAATRLLALGMLERTAGCLRLTRRALPVANQVFAAFV